MDEQPRIKIVLIGESGVGKTNLIQVAMGNPFQEDIDSTISSSYYEGDIIINNKQYLYSLWDTAGQEAYRSLNKIFIKESKIVLVVFAINSRQSFEQTDFWFNYTKEVLGENNYIMALVGNKSDLYMEQQIPEEEIKKKADEFKIKMKITSALEDAVGFKQFLDELIKDFVHTFGIKLENKKTFALKSEKDVEVEEGEDNNGKGKKKKKKKCC